MYNICIECYTQDVKIFDRHCRLWSEQPEEDTRGRKLNRGLTGGFLLLRNFSVAISVSPHVCFILV